MIYCGSESLYTRLLFKKCIFKLLKISLIKNHYILLVTLLISFTINAQIIDIPDANFKNALVNSNCVDTNGDGWGNIDADSNDDGEIDLSEAMTITNLRIPSNNIVSLSGIENFTNLTNLNCVGNQINDLSFVGLSNLTHLYCQDNNLTSLDISGLTNLVELRCFLNEITTLTFGSLTNLTTIDCNRNQLPVLDLSNLPGLISLNCSINQISDLNISNLSNLENLNCSENNLTELNLNGLSNLEYVRCESNQISLISADVSSNINYLSCSENLLTELSEESFPNLNDLEITIIPLQLARPGFNTNYRLIYKNKGTSVLSGSVDLNFQDDLMDFVSATPTEDAQSANLLTWNFTDLEPFESRNIDFTITINSPMDTPPINSDDVLEFIATLHTSETDETPDDNTFELNQTVVNSYDPNDKTCLEGDFITPEMVGEYVHYMIRFENTGSAEAVNIIVKDDIDVSKYDLFSLVPLHASHNYVARIKDNTTDHYVEFIFENITLPFDDANNDGYVVFKIKTLDTLVLNDTFENNAEIYFDFNFPIITNIAQTTIATLSDEDFELANNTISLYPNPTTHSLNLESTEAIHHFTIYDISGRLINEIAVIGLKTELTISTEALSTGTYFVKIKTETSEIVKKIIKD